MGSSLVHKNAAIKMLKKLASEFVAPKLCLAQTEVLLTCICFRC